VLYLVAQGAGIGTGRISCGANNAAPEAAADCRNRRRLCRRIVIVSSIEHFVGVISRKRRSSAYSIV